MNKKECMLYLHIPFCIKKCYYCDFLSAPAAQEEIEEYIGALCQEIQYHKERMQNYEVVSIYVGGGTPSILAPTQIKKLFHELRNSFLICTDAEITIECNPGTITREKITAYKEAGINRISFGLQSTNDDELRRLGRIHTYEQFLESYQLSRQCGFDNINIDIMSALPGQSVASYQDTINKVIALAPEHISAYSLIIEEGTPFWEEYGQEKQFSRKIKIPKDMTTATLKEAAIPPGWMREDQNLFALPSEEDERVMYYDTIMHLSKAGYEQYEVSNFAKPGYECKHNMGYWTGKEYLGLGLGASSYLNGERFSGEQSLFEYMRQQGRKQSMYHEKKILSMQEKMEEFMFLGLRLTKGIRRSDFLKNFEVSIDHIYGAVIEKQEKQGLLSCENDLIALTALGRDFSNRVLADYLLEEEEK